MLSKIKLIRELKKVFPKMQKHDDIADVLLIGETLNAVNESSRTKKWKFILRGATSNAFYRAYNYNLLDKRKSVRRAFVMCMRGIRVKDRNDTRKALKKELTGLLKHLASNSTARNSVATYLSLSSSSLSLIKQELEKGTPQDQLITYGKVVNHLILEKKYNKNYDYYWMGFRFIADQYWLSDIAHRILSKAI